MRINYTKSTLVEINQYINILPSNVILTGSDLSIPEIIADLYGRFRIAKIFVFLKLTLGGRG